MTTGLPLVGIRIPNHALTLELLKMLPFPLAAPSANMFGYISPTTAEHVEKGLGDKIPYILNGGKCSVGVESTIISFEHKVPSILRKGGVSIEAIEKLIGKITIADVSSSNPKAPGMLQSHYAPSKPLYLGNILENLQKYADKKPGILSFKQDYQQPIQYILSPNGHLEQAAHNLFEALRFLDDSPCECILAEKAPEQGLGKAINDRLLRASSET